MQASIYIEQDAVGVAAHIEEDLSKSVSYIQSDTAAVGTYLVQANAG